MPSHPHSLLGQWALAPYRPSSRLEAPGCPAQGENGCSRIHGYLHGGALLVNPAGRGQRGHRRWARCGQGHVYWGPASRLLPPPPSSVCEPTWPPCCPTLEAWRGEPRIKYSGKNSRKVPTPVSSECRRRLRDKSLRVSPEPSLPHAALGAATASEGGSSTLVSSLGRRDWFPAGFGGLAAWGGCPGGLPATHYFRFVWPSLLRF